VKPPILHLDGVAKRFGATTVVHPFQLQVMKGEFIALMGPSGCGKTTTLRMVAGLERPSEGAVRMWGRAIDDDKPWERDTPLVWQNYALFPFLNVVENVEFGLKQRGLPRADRRKKANEWLERMGIADHAKRDIKLLSGGQRQRVALARALVTEPELLLLDEPLSALDAHLRVRMQSELSRLHRELGITFLYVTHNQSEAFAMAGRVVIMKDGHVQQIGTPNEVYRAPANRFVAEFVGTNNILGGTVRGYGDGLMLVETRVGNFQAPVNGGARPSVGTQGEFIVAADRIALSSHRSGGGNEVIGRFVTQEFVGTVVTVFLELADGREFRVQKQQHEVEALGLQVGQEVVASWEAYQAYALPIEGRNPS
jgi:spermidine/putrescine transport system ATP-binding protein